MTILGTNGNDHLTGSSHADAFDVSQGGDDTIHAKGGNDTVYFGAALTAADLVDGGAGKDSVLLAGDYAGSNSLVLESSTIRNVDHFDLGDGFSYDLAFGDSVVAAGATMDVEAGNLSATDSLSFSADTEHDGNYRIIGGAGDDVLRSGWGDDVVAGGDGRDQISTEAGNDTIGGGAGGDVITFYGADAFGPGDVVDGGDGVDAIDLDGDYSGGLAITHAMITNVERLSLVAGFDYKLDLTHLDAPNATIFTVDGGGLGAGDTLIVDASHMVEKRDLSLYGGPGDDALTGGRGANFFLGGGGADTLTAGSGKDQFVYELASDSTGPNYDTVVGFDAHHDVFGVGVVDVLDPTIAHGTLRAGHFNDDLVLAVQAEDLTAKHAVLYHPDHGSLKGEWFLIVDCNDEAGYQANADYVIHLQSPKHISDFGPSDFEHAA